MAEERSAEKKGTRPRLAGAPTGGSEAGGSGKPALEKKPGICGASQSHRKAKI